MTSAANLSKIQFTKNLHILLVTNIAAAIAHAFRMRYQWKRNYCVSVVILLLILALSALILECLRIP